MDKGMLITCTSVYNQFYFQARSYIYYPAFSLQAARDIADTLSKGRGVVYLPNSSNMLMSLNAGGGM